MSDLRLVHVVGTGLLGTSIGMALRSLDVDVTLADPSPSAVSLARDLGAGRVARDTEQQEPDLVVVAAPPDVAAEVVATALITHPTSVVTDVASVKSAVLRRLRHLEADLTRYVGGHPMAGRERSGAVAGRADLFAGRPWVLTPTAETSPDAVAQVRSLAERLGSTVTLMDAREHDEAVAVVSHVPQVAASLVAARLREVSEQAAALCGQGIRDVTRIAAGDPALWTQILAGNAGAVARTLHAVRDDLDAVIAAVDALDSAADGDAPGARAAVAGLVAAGNDGHARIPGKHGAPPTAYASVPVIVPDRPGALARLLHDVGAAGVNLEDLRLEHSEGRPMAVAEIDVLPAAVPALVAALQERGWSVHD